MATTCAKMPLMAPGRGRGGSIESEFRRFKRRLEIVLQNTSKTQEGVSALLRERHVEVSRSTISRWMQEDDPAAPSQREMMALMMGHQDISIDWLLGRRDAESVAEKFIESRI